MKKIAYVCVLLLVSAAYTSAYAEMSVVSVKGDFAAMIDGKWKPLAAGTKIAEGTKVSTGTKSSAVIKIDDHVVTIGPVSSVKLYKNYSSDVASDTSVGIQFGSVRAKVKKTATVKTRFNITTPVATSSVRGTEESVYFGSVSGMKIEVLEGSIGAFNLDGVSSRVSGRKSFVLGANSSRPEPVNSLLRSAAVVTVTPSGTTKGERDAIDKTGGEDVDAAGGTGPVQGPARVKVGLIYK
jgi:hypothetical protein